jgi:hypothetical protein
MRRFEGDSITVLCARIVQLEAELDEVRTNYHNDQVKWQARIIHDDESCISRWVVEDIEWSCRHIGHSRPTRDQAINILKDMENNMDASIGISWDTIYYYIQESPLAEMPNGYYDDLEEDDWGDHPLNNICEHIHYRVTLTGAECIDCGLEHEEVSE